jgi:hypothetical protein
MPPSLPSLIELGQSLRAQIGALTAETVIQVPEGDIVIQDRAEYARKKMWRRIGLVVSLCVSVGSFVCVLYSTITGSSVSTLVTPDGGTPAPPLEP